MNSLAMLDFLIIGLFLGISFLIAFYTSKKENSLQSYFQSEGKLSWFISGTAMVATTFAADTPLAVTELVQKNGISGNWLWWYMSIGTLVTVYVFAPLWKKSGVTTDVELIEIRYSGNGAKYLRIFKSIYLGIFLNVLILSWVNLAMKEIVEVLVPEYSSFIIVGFLCFFAFVYTSWVGLTGISYVDAFQFFFAMLGCIILAYLALQLPTINGIDGLKEKLSTSQIQFLPTFSGNGSFSVASFLALILVGWWSSWYPGSEPGGGGYIAQRILATQNTKSSVLSTLWFSIAHYFLRPWPWIIVALVSIVLFPNLPVNEAGKGFILVMKESLPTGLFGFLLAGFMAAYLSTVATHLNWGTSYIINDVYKPFWKPNKTDSHYIQIAKLVEVFLMLGSLILTFTVLTNITSAWKILIEGFAGVGFALIARWFWPKINAWAELAGFIVPILLHITNYFYLGIESPYSIYYNAFGTVIIVVLVANFSETTNDSTLQKFYETVNPPGIIWKNWAKQKNIPIHHPYINLYSSTVLVFSGLICIFSGLFLVGNLIFKNYEETIIPLILLVFSGFMQYWFLRHKKKD
jgi:SSS family solute:Na+ symporter